MKINDWLNQATRQMEQASVATARLDALVLLEDVLGKNRAWILANDKEVISQELLLELQQMIKRRVRHEPLAYIRGHSELYGRTFKVTPATLQPRPETETMIELLKQLEKGGGLRVEGGVADIGTGSGCIAITAKLEWPELSVVATEISDDALTIAKQNAKILGADVRFYKGNLLEPLFTLNPQPSTLLCNLPYVPDGHTINQAAMQEPRIAIFGGEDGLDLYREMFAQIKSDDTRYVFTESLPFQHPELTNIAKSHGWQEVIEEDFIQVFGRRD